MPDKFKKIIFLIIAITFVACSNRDESARELYNKALSVYQTGNKQEGRKLLQELIDKYPETQLAVDINKQLFVQKQYEDFIDEKKQKTKKATKKMLSAALDAYKFDTGRYPLSTEGIQAVIHNVSGSQNWGGPYLSQGLPPYEINYQSNGESYTLTLDD